MRIVLDQPTGYTPEPKQGNPQEIVDRFGETTRDWSSGDLTRKLVCVENNLKGDVFQGNFLEALARAYAQHQGIVITPDIIWHTLLSEAVLIVGDKPQVYAGLFTNKTEEKQRISIPAAGSECDLKSLTEAIKRHVPANADTFMPDFSTSTPAARLARMAAFADLVSPFYSYGVFACGLPHVDVQGTQEDWRRVRDNWQDIGRMLHGNDEYFGRTGEIVNRIYTQTDSKALWQDMITTQTCGSGSQQELFGWFTDLFKTQPRRRMAHNYSTHIAKVCYEQEQSKDEYELKHGIFMSSVAQDSDFPTVTTSFGSIWYHRPKTPVVEKK